MNELTSLALELQSFCEQRNWRFCLIGGLAVQHWGEPRFTKDVDMTLLTGFGNEEPFIAEWLASYKSRVPDPASFALCNRVLLLRSSSGIGIDIALGALPFEESAIAHAKRIELEPGAYLRICSAEDLIVMKASVSGGILRMAGNHPNDGDQRLLLDAERVTGREVFPDAFQIEARLGGNPGGEGAYHVGVSVGNVRVLFHPGYPSGGFRIERVDNHRPLIGNTAMGFDPPAGKLLRLHLDVQRCPSGDVEIQAVLSNGGPTFRKSVVLAAGEIGKLDHIGLDRSGRTGGDGLFDDFVLHLGEP